MEAQSKRQRWTYAEFARLPSEGGTRHEIIDGRLVVTPAPALLHQRIVTELVAELHTFVRAYHLGLGQVFSGPVDVLFAEGDYLEPDIVFVRKNRFEILSDRGIEGPPDLVVEVLSPSTATRDRGIKLERYRLYGVPQYWVVDPEERTVEVWELHEGAQEPSIHGPPGMLRWAPDDPGAALEIDLEDLFRAPGD